eukprot:4572230-Prymnesium_polylepis.1
MYIFPGVGLGASVCLTETIPDSMLYHAAVRTPPRTPRPRAPPRAHRRARTAARPRPHPDPH